MWHKFDLKIASGTKKENLRKSIQQVRVWSCLVKYLRLRMDRIERSDFTLYD